MAFAPGARKDFQKGWKGGPGAPKTPPDIREAREMNRFELEKLINRFIYMDRKELRKFVEKKKCTAIEAMIASIVDRAISTADHVRLDFVLTRLIGHVPIRIEAKVQRPEPAIDRLSEDELHNLLQLSEKIYPNMIEQKPEDKAIAVTAEIIDPNTK